MTSETALRTLPASWYASRDHFARERDAIFRHGWSCVGVTDDVADPGSYMTADVGGQPVLVVRDTDGTLRAFLNVCRHRGSPLVATDGEPACGHARALGCPYHGWVFRLDGSLSRANGMDGVAGFDPAESALFPVAVTTWARFVFVNPSAGAAAEQPFDLGPLAAALDPYPLDSYVLHVREQHRRAFNWKVGVENFSENFHTPFVHPELVTAGWDYPLVTDGPVCLAWDRPLDPRSDLERALATARPGDRDWAGVVGAAGDSAEPYIAGVYATVFPNLLISIFPRYMSALHLTPVAPNLTLQRNYRFWTPDADEEQRATELAAAHVVAEQDLSMCEAVQRGYDAGIDTDGWLSPAWENGVAHVHGLVRGALDGSR
ncbi:MAG TPA: aromatic ring-hydroxylating dioxygenase subunit alpha [Ilumatobacter sp.]|nr:aromatic ring-hydroxylating dioxygenase subunit alpha [Ilumatobacter sp.]